MAFYSFIVVAPQPIGIPKPMILLDAGMNTFNAVVDDLDGLMETFQDEGVQVVQVNRLDAFESEAPLLLDGERPAGLGPGVPES